MSGEELALKVGYKTQSGISNLENRNGGMGGAKVVRIAKELDISLQWLLNGPDTAEMSTVPAFATDSAQNLALGVQEAAAEYVSDRMIAHKLIDSMSDQGIMTITEILRMTADRYPRTHENGAGDSIPAQKRKA